MTRLMRPASRRLMRLLIAFVITGSLLPFGIIVGAQETGDVPGTPVTLTFTTVELLEPGVEWEDADGVYHLRNELELNSVSGDVEGAAMITINGDFVITGECNEEFCEGAFLGWVHADIDSESGGWTGDMGFIARGEAGYTEFRGMLVGNGENAGKVIYIDTFVAEDEEAITLSGHLIERGLRPEGINIRFDGCFTSFDGSHGTVGGGFILHGIHDDSGSISANFTAVGAPIPGVVFGDVTFTGSQGTILGTFVEASYTGGADFGVGAFVLTGGTGAYEGLYGYGRVIETAVFGQSGVCDGPKAYWIGETFAR